ncbi:hypothetical protein EZS27_035820, partial [termite gut metagenome]
KRYVTIIERKTKKDWAAFIEEIAENYKDAKKITLVTDNYDTHKAVRCTKPSHLKELKHYGIDLSLYIPPNTEVGSIWLK